jgi:hypothetical protein
MCHAHNPVHVLSVIGSVFLSKKPVSEKHMHLSPFGTLHGVGKKTYPGCGKLMTFFYRLHDYGKKGADSQGKKIYDTFRVF